MSEELDRADNLETGGSEAAGWGNAGVAESVGTGAEENDGAEIASLAGVAAAGVAAAADDAGAAAAAAAAADDADADDAAFDKRITAIRAEADAEGVRLRQTLDEVDARLEAEYTALGKRVWDASRKDRSLADKLGTALVAVAAQVDRREKASKQLEALDAKTASRIADVEQARRAQAEARRLESDLAEKEAAAREAMERAQSLAEEVQRMREAREAALHQADKAAFSASETSLLSFLPGKGIAGGDDAEDVDGVTADGALQYVSPQGDMDVLAGKPFGEDGAAPEDEAVPPENEAAPEDEAVPPENEAAPEDDAAPENQAVPEGEAAPEDDAAPENKAAPEDEALPENEAAPSENAAHETAALDDVAGEGTDRDAAPVPEASGRLVPPVILAEPDDPSRTLLLSDEGPDQSAPSDDVSADPGSTMMLSDDDDSASWAGTGAESEGSGSCGSPESEGSADGSLPVWHGTGEASGSHAHGAGLPTSAATGQPAPAAVQQPAPAMAGQPAPAAVQAGSRCPSCGAAVNPGDKFCMACGFSLLSAVGAQGQAGQAQVPGHVAPQVLLCPSCGAEYDPDDHYCMTCGYKIK